MPSKKKRKNTHKKLSFTPSGSLIHTKAYWEAIVEELLKLKCILSEKKPDPSDQEDEEFKFLFD